MLWQSSYFIWSIFCLLMLDQMHLSSGIICKAGEMTTHLKTSCVPCPPRQYNPSPTDSNECLTCVPCGVNSVQVSKCTATNNIKCRCLEGFVPLDNTHKRCKCMPDSVIKTLGDGSKICQKCPPKTFPNTTNSKCQPLPEYVESIEKIAGNGTSDVIWGDVAKTAVPPSSPLPVSQTSTGTSTATPTTSRNSVATPTPSIPETQDSRKHALWLVFLISFLLLILILKLSRSPKKKRDLERQGSACGKPVEESGEKFLPPV